MSRIKIKNFGPIKEGCQDDDGWIEVKKVTVFVGHQGFTRKNTFSIDNMLVNILEYNGFRYTLPITAIKLRNFRHSHASGNRDGLDCYGFQFALE